MLDRYYTENWVKDGSVETEPKHKESNRGGDKKQPDLQKKFPFPAWLAALLVVAFLALLALGAWAFWPHPDPTKSVVFIYAPLSGGIQSGSGAILTSDGLILTNKHVVTEDNKPLDHIQVRVNSGTAYFHDYPATVVSVSDSEIPANEGPANMYHDWAFLKISADNLTPMPVGSSRPDKLKTGAEVRAIGFPSVTLAALQGELKNGPGPDSPSGNLSSFVPSPNEPYAIVNTCPIQQGNSGGPLVDAQGELIGINTCFDTDKAGNHRSLAIAVHMLETQLEAQHVPFPK